MEFLKYLDVLIGLALVMVLLSPLVSAFTQLWLWLTNTRSGRLQVGVKHLLLLLNGNSYERFEAVRVAGYAPGTLVSLTTPGFPSVNATVDGAGVAIFANDVGARLAAGNGNLTFEPAIAQGQTVTLLAGGPVDGWQVTSATTDTNGAVTMKYNFPGRMPFTSFRALATVPPATTLMAKIASGRMKETPLVVTPGPPVTIEYPPNAQPVDAAHDLEITLKDAAGAPVTGQQVTLKFERNPSYDLPAPLPAPAVITGLQADSIAEAVLLHPMVAQPSFLRKLRSRRSRRAEVIEREELVRILLEFAANQAAADNGLAPQTLATLRQLLQENGISNPGRVLAGIRDTAQELEKMEPTLASHARFTKAIITAGASDFVGKINNWFDQAMARTTAEYKFRAQLITVIGAFLVAFAVQMDSLDLLKRLSTDDKLRDSLIKQAQEQQKRMDDQAKAPKQDQDEIQLAKARREEIEANLARLRDPQMSILPDHFIWQPLPQARLVRNSAWTHPYSRRLELVVGASAYSIEPNWRTDPLLDIKAAIDGSGAPVSTRLEKNREAMVRMEDLSQLQLKVDGTDRLTRDGEFARAVLQEKPAANEVLQLLAGYHPTATIQADAQGGIGAIAKIPNIPIAVGSDGKVLTATNSEIRWIELRRGTGDRLINILQPTMFIRQTGRLDAPALAQGKQCEIVYQGKPNSVPCDLIKVVDSLHTLRVHAEPRDHLVLISRRNPPLQLRSVPGRPESNMLNSAPEQSCRYFCIDGETFKRSVLGLLVTWMLLSLGAPFWYDVLKDSLKLRSSLAKNEEDARNDRQSDNTRAQTNPA